jgi:hypothetical protein
MTSVIGNKHSMSVDPKKARDHQPKVVVMCQEDFAFKFCGDSLTSRWAEPLCSGVLSANAWLQQLHQQQSPSANADERYRLVSQVVVSLNLGGNDLAKQKKIRRGFGRSRRMVRGSANLLLWIRFVRQCRGRGLLLDLSTR